jgi:ethanolamine ammonia-lyase small subunit
VVSLEVNDYKQYLTRWHMGRKWEVEEDTDILQEELMQCSRIGMMSP